MTDYKELLKKYIAHVGLYEGADFIDKIHNNKGFMTDVPFSDNEVKELEYLSDEAYAEFND